MTADEPSRPSDGPSAYDGAAMQDLVYHVATSLVDNQEAVQVTRQERGPGVDLRLKVDPEEMGKVIGRQGRVAKALRSVLAAAATRAGRRVNLEIG
jgi:uncharacterized protein